MTPLLLALCLTPGAADDSQTLVYLSESGPVVIKLHMQLDGKSFRARFDDFLDALFKEIDRDGDGELSESEIAAAPQPSSFAPGPGLPGLARTVVARPTRGKLDRKGLAAHYALSGLKPFTVGTQPRETAVIRIDALNSGPRSAAEVNKRLFELLDANEDGKLSRAELEAAPRVLGKLDRDEDEMIDLDELLRTASAPAAPAPVATPARPLMMPSTDTGPLHLVTDGSDATLAARLLATYAKKGERHLDGRALGLGDGKLEAEDLARLGSRKPDLEAIVRLGERGGKPVLEVLKKAERAGIEIAERGGKLTLTAGKTIWASRALIGPSPSISTSRASSGTPSRWPTRTATATSRRRRASATPCSGRRTRRWTATATGSCISRRCTPGSSG
jgi:hypothetical protein